MPELAVPSSVPALVTSPQPVRASSSGASPLATIGSCNAVARRPAPRASSEFSSAGAKVPEAAELPGGYLPSDRVSLHLGGGSFTWAPMFRRLGLGDGDQGTVVGMGVVPGTLLVLFDRSTGRPVGIDPEQLSLAREQLCLGQLRGRLGAALAARAKAR